MGIYNDTQNDVNSIVSNDTNSTKLTIGLTSKLVSAFESYVHYIKETSDKIDNNELSTSKDALSYIGSTVTSALTGKLFDNKLYSEATSLSESEQTVFEYLDKFSSSGYGTFNGGITYKSFDGIKDVSNNDLNASKKSACDGWFTLSEYLGGNYGTFQSVDSIYIIDKSQFTPKIIISDFMPLYILLSAKIQKSRLKDDITSLAAKVTNHKQEVADSLNNTSNNIISEPVTPSENKDSIKAQETVTNNPQSSDIPSDDQRAEDTTDEVKESDKYILDGNIQAIVYDLANGDNSKNTKSLNILMSYQQPDNISYTAASTYEPVSTRGSQVPFQFYQSANQIQLSFSMKWHKDELESLNKHSILHQSYTTLATVAEMAEDFTRPWKYGNSIIPKEVGVILPGITAKGYMESAVVTYSGSLTGDAFQSDDLKSDEQRRLSRDQLGDNRVSGIEYKGDDAFRTLYGPKGVKNYGYDQLEVQFTLIVIKDVTLRSKSEAEKNISEEDTDSSKSTTTTDSQFAWISKDYVSASGGDQSVNVNSGLWSLPDGSTLTPVNTTSGIWRYNNGYFVRAETGVLLSEYLDEYTPKVDPDWPGYWAYDVDGESFLIERETRILTDNTGSEFSPNKFSTYTSWKYGNNATITQPDDSTGVITYADGTSITSEYTFGELYFFTSPYSSAAHGTGTITTKKDDLNARAEPNDKAKIVGTVKRGSTVDILGEENNYYKISLNSVKQKSKQKSKHSAVKPSYSVERDTPLTPEFIATHKIYGLNTKPPVYPIMISNRMLPDGSILLMSGRVLDYVGNYYLTEDDSYHDIYRDMYSNYYIDTVFEIDFVNDINANFG